MRAATASKDNRKRFGMSRQFKLAGLFKGHSTSKLGGDAGPAMELGGIGEHRAQSPATSDDDGTSPTGKVVRRYPARSALLFPRMLGSDRPGPGVTVSVFTLLPLCAVVTGEKARRGQQFGSRWAGFRACSVESPAKVETAKAGSMVRGAAESRARLAQQAPQLWCASGPKLRSPRGRRRWSVSGTRCCDDRRRGWRRGIQRNLVGTSGSRARPGHVICGGVGAVAAPLTLPQLHCVYCVHCRIATALAVLAGCRIGFARGSRRASFTGAGGQLQLRWREPGPGIG